MDEMMIRQALWAMHPDALAAMLQRESIGARVPAGLRAFLGAAAPESQQSAPDPVREGGTIILSLSGVMRPYYTEPLAERIFEAAADTKIGAIVLKIMSPGGLVWGTQELGDAVFSARQAKPVIAIADKYSFSAAHWVATQASAYYATPSGQVGSVGVRGGHVDTSGFEDKIGMKTTLIASDPKKIAGHPYAPLSDEDRDEKQAEINEMAQAFNAAIARGRGIDLSSVPEIHGTGQIYSAQNAARRGVIDGVMTLREVVAKYSAPRARLGLMRKRAALQSQIAAI